MEYIDALSPFSTDVTSGQTCVLLPPNLLVSSKMNDARVGPIALVERGPSNSLYMFLEGVAKAALYCAHRTSTV